MQDRAWSKTLGLALGALAAMGLAACSDNAADAPAVPAESAASADGGGDLPEIPVMGPERRIIAFGDSLFAGYRLAEEEGYPERLEAALRAGGINARVVDAGVSGDTSAAGRQRLAFTLDAQDVKPDLFILELGGNDLLRGLSPAETRANFEAMLDDLKRREIPVLLMGMRAPANYGGEFQAQFDALYGDLARDYDVALIPFWLEDIYRDPSLFQSDRIHPTAEGIEKLVASTLDEVKNALPEDEG
ncbi:arylesterase [Erythrobacter sp. JK5]|uniref:arylesterase n=1 Tax=Erythrobacter sp. JK5 TaxID=2829500 RepID=UPI001BA72CA8|nr:arylesterase [Erythrobacter sp. JK5]QUL38220.1 arylesterase [Erythrobacter sp. JK5]